MQSTQAEDEPHIVGDVPAMHMPVAPPQQNPAPHPPPSQAALHEPAVHVGVAGPHEMHATPPDPHSMSESPDVHIMLSQHPPLQVSPPMQLAPQKPVFGSHASPFSQLVDVVHGT
jgi:hypothetical protein